MNEKTFVALQYVLPKQWLTQLAGVGARARLGAWTHAFIGWFVRKYQVNMDEAAQPDITQYACFNDFFTRA
jgi:phosphatidylserine decarboxylase